MSDPSCVSPVAQAAAAHPGLWVAIVAFLASSLGIILGIGIGIIWKRLETLEKRQISLREDTLPKEFVRSDALEDLKIVVEKFVQRFEDFIVMCASGKCQEKRGPAGHHSHNP